MNTGDDIAGTIHSVGANVTEFKPGDRVAAFHEMMKPAGSFAEYGVSYEHTTFHLPKGTSYEGKHARSTRWARIDAPLQRQPPSRSPP
jgi:NADPH2:quinone reductase